MFDVDDIKKYAFLIIACAVAGFTAWFVFGGSGDFKKSVAEKYLIEQLEVEKEKVEMRDIQIDSVLKVVDRRDLQIIQLFDDTTRIHNYYIVNPPTRSERDSIRAAINPR